VKYMAYPTVTRVLIIGGGFAGLECARQLAGCPTIEVTLIDKTNHHLFQPLLYQVATATLSAPDIARSLRSVLAKAENVKVLMDEIIDLDYEKKEAGGTSGKVYAYDKLVVCAGGKTSFFGNNHWEPHTIGLKSLGDAYKCRSSVLNNLEKAELCVDEEQRKKLMTIAIVGGGPTGVELSGAFAELIKRSMQRNFRCIDVTQLRVILIEAGDRLLPPFKECLSEYTKKRLEKLGVEVRTGSMVTDVQEEKVFLGDEVINAGTILWAAGIEAAPVTKLLPTELNRAGKVTPELDLSLKGHPDIFVAGDLVHMKDAANIPVPGVAPAASQMGKLIAKHIIAEYKGASPSQREEYVYWDKGSMAIVGRSAAVMEYGKIKLTGFLAWIGWLFIHVMFLIGFRSKASVLLQWAWSYLTDKPGARVFSPERDLRCADETKSS